MVWVLEHRVWVRRKIRQGDRPFFSSILTRLMV